MPEWVNGWAVRKEKSLLENMNYSSETTNEGEGRWETNEGGEMQMEWWGQMLYILCSNLQCIIWFGFLG